MDMDMDMEIDPVLLLREMELNERKTMFMNHILLPRKLPHENYESYDTDLDLMNRMVENVQSLSEHLPAKTVRLLEKLRQIYLNCTPQAVSQAINMLSPGDTFAMFLRSQDCAIMFHVPKDENVNNVQNAIIAIMPGSLEPSKVYECIESDIKVIFPF